ncbi:MAG: hypothetical protein OHK0021_05870 [Bryobacter sp.]
MAARTEVYLDSGGLIAFLDDSDSFHSLYRRLFSDPPRLVSSFLVLTETNGWFLRRYDRRKAEQFLAFLDRFGACRFVPFDEGAIAEVAGVIRNYRDQKLTFADAHGLAIIKARKIQTVWATDWHWTLGGARLVSEP